MKKMTSVSFFVYSDTFLHFLIITLCIAKILCFNIFKNNIILLNNLKKSIVIDNFLLFMFKKRLITLCLFIISLFFYI